MALIDELNYARNGLGLSDEQAVAWVLGRLDTEYNELQKEYGRLREDRNELNEEYLALKELHGRKSTPETSGYYHPSDFEADGSGYAEIKVTCTCGENEGCSECPDYDKYYLEDINGNLLKEGDRVEVKEDLVPKEERGSYKSSIAWMSGFLVWVEAGTDYNFEYDKEAGWAIVSGASITFLDDTLESCLVKI